MKGGAVVRQSGLSRSIHRINAALRAAAPADVELVDAPEQADLQPHLAPDLRPLRLMATRPDAYISRQPTQIRDRKFRVGP